jgi:hypothetical protein
MVRVSTNLNDENRRILRRNIENALKMSIICNNKKTNHFVLDDAPKQTL